MINQLCLLSSGAAMILSCAFLMASPADDDSKSPERRIVPQENNGRLVVYASSYAKLNSNVEFGGGDDDTEAIQAILNMAPKWGGLHLIMDGAALVRGLDVYSNTTIECENKACGFFLADGSNRSLLQNAHLSFKNRQDKNITILGGTYNHNAKGQVHHLQIDEITDSSFDETKKEIAKAFDNMKVVIAMEFYGVEHLTLKDVTIRNQRTFAMLVANWFRVNMENITIELPDNMFAQNQDGIHFWGPGRFLSMRNIMGESGDDFIALAPDEHDEESDITDVMIDGVFLNNADQGIRMLSRGKGKLDRVIVRNVTGTYKSIGFFLNAWFPGSGGNYGNITFENIDLRQTVHKYTYVEPLLFRIGGHYESLTLKNISYHNPKNAINLFEVGIPFYTPNDDKIAEHSHIGRLVIDGLQVYAKDGADQHEKFITVICPVDDLIVRNAVIQKSEPDKEGGSLIETNDDADIGNLHISGLTITAMNTLINHKGGKITNLSMSDILATDMANPLIIGDGKITNLYTNFINGVKVK